MGYGRGSEGGEHGRKGSMWETGGWGGGEKGGSGQEAKREGGAGGVCGGDAPEGIGVVGGARKKKWGRGKEEAPEPLLYPKKH